MALFQVVDGLTLKPIEIEGLLLTIVVILGSQEAWFVAMTPRREILPTGEPAAGAPPT